MNIIKNQVIEPHEIYRSIMMEIKYRIKAIETKFKHKGNLTPLNSEFCFLQIRKIIENICFSIILCDEETYSNHRKLEYKTKKK